MLLLAEGMELFAQAGGQMRPAGGGNAGAGGGAGGMVGGLACVGLYFLLIIVMIVVQIFFLLAMSRALKACKPRNRTMEPGQVWLVFIPLVGIVFFIMMLFKIPESLKNEYDDRRMRGDGDFGKTLGIWYLVTAFLCGPVGLVLWIMYWLKINSYTKELTGGKSSGGRISRDRDMEDFEEDEPPKRKRRARDDDDEDEDDRPRQR